MTESIKCPTCGAGMDLIKESNGNFSAPDDEWTAKYYACAECGATLERVWLGSTEVELVEEVTAGKPIEKDENMPADFHRPHRLGTHQIHKAKVPHVI